ncbi:hypothetical protein U1Q18_041244 [Sarracenia purpurea var. burkii]
MDRVSSPISALVCNCMVGLLSPLLSKACSSAVALVFLALKGQAKVVTGKTREAALDGKKVGNRIRGQTKQGILQSITDARVTIDSRRTGKLTN